MRLWLGDREIDVVESGAAQGQQLDPAGGELAGPDGQLLLGKPEGSSPLRATNRNRREDQEKNAVTVLIAEPIWGNKEILSKEPSNAATLSDKVNKTENQGTKI